MTAWGKQNKHVFALLTIVGLEIALSQRPKPKKQTIKLKNKQKRKSAMFFQLRTNKTSKLS